MLNVVGINVDVSGAGPFTLVDGSAHNGIKIFRILLTFRGGSPKVSFYSGATRLPGTFLMDDGGAMAFGLELRRWAETAPGESFIMHLSEPCDVAGALTVEYLP